MPPQKSLALVGLLTVIFVVGTGSTTLNSPPVAASALLASPGVRVADLPLNRHFHLQVGPQTTLPLPSSVGLCITQAAIDGLTTGTFETVTISVNGTVVAEEAQGGLGLRSSDFNPGILVPPGATLGVTSTGGAVSLSGYQLEPSDFSGTPVLTGLRVSDLPLSRHIHFPMQSGTVQLPASVGFAISKVTNQEGSVNADFTVVINGQTVLRRYIFGGRGDVATLNPPIVVPPGATVQFSTGISGVNIGGFILNPADL